MFDRFASYFALIWLLIVAVCTGGATAAPIDDDAGPSAIDLGPIVPAEDEPPDEAPTEGGIREIKQAQAALLAGDVKGCRDKLRAAYAQHPNLPPPKVMLARLLLAHGQLAMGRQTLEDAARSYPNHPDVYLLFGGLALRDGHVTDAALHFEKAGSLEIPSNWNEDQRKYLDIKCLDGRTTIAEMRGDWDEAAKLYQQQVDASPKDANLRDRFAMALFRGGELDRAFEQFDIAHLQSDEMNPPEVSMAVMYVRDGNYQRADQWFQKALDEHGDDPKVHFERSIALLYDDRTDEAERSAAKAAELGMDSTMLTMHRGLIAMQKGDWAQAGRYFQSILDGSPENVGAMTKLALALVAQQDGAKRQQAMKLARQAATKAPNAVEVASTLGWVLFQSGDSEQAGPLLQAAAQSGDPMALYFYTRWLDGQDDAEQTQAAAKLLQERIDQPGLFVLRPEARRWLPTVLAEQN